MKNIKTLLVIFLSSVILVSCSSKYTANQDILKDYFSYLEKNDTDKALSLWCSSGLKKDEPSYWISVAQESDFIRKNTFSDFSLVGEQNITNDQWIFKREFFDLKMNWKTKRTFIDLNKKTDWNICIYYLDFSGNDWSSYFTEKEKDDQLVNILKKKYNSSTWSLYIRESDLENMTALFFFKTTIWIALNKAEIDSVKNRLVWLNEKWIIKISFTPISDEDKIKDLNDNISNIVIPEIFTWDVLSKTPKEKSAYFSYIDTINSIWIDSIKKIAWNPDKIGLYQNIIDYILNSNRESKDGPIILDSPNLKALARTIFLLENTIGNNFSGYSITDENLKKSFLAWMNYYTSNTDILVNWKINEDTIIWITWRNNSISANHFKTYYLNLKPIDKNKVIVEKLSNPSWQYLDKIHSIEEWTIITKKPTYQEIDK